MIVVQRSSQAKGKAHISPPNFFHQRHQRLCPTSCPVKLHQSAWWTEQNQGWFTLTTNKQEKNKNKQTISKYPHPPQAKNLHRNHQQTNKHIFSSTISRKWESSFCFICSHSEISASKIYASTSTMEVNIVCHAHNTEQL